MENKREIDPTFYETHCFAEDMAEADARGDLVVYRPGENVFQAIERHKREKELAMAVKALRPISAARSSIKVPARAWVSSKLKLPK